MSYLDYPRLHFAGTFQADVVTVNNMPSYYDNAVFEPRFQRRMRLPDINGAWNPRGGNAIRLTDIRVTSVAGPDGTISTAEADDPIVGGRVLDDDHRPSGSFVDLDPELQLVPEIWGMRMRFVDAHGNELLRGDFVPAAMADMWIRDSHPSGRGDPAACYQSVLAGLRWAKPLTSSGLAALRAATHEGLLSIKFNMDGVEDGEDHLTDPPPDVTFGRMVGSVAPYASGEPRHFVAARRLRAAEAPGSPMHDAPCRIDRSRGLVVIDLGNSVKATSPRGPLVDTGPLRLAALDDGGPRVLAPLEGLDPGYYERTAGIVTATLTEEQSAVAARARLAVVTADATPTVLLAENADASVVRADGSVFRLWPEHPYDTGTTVLAATRFGEPASGVDLFISAAPPQLRYQETVRTNAAGQADVSMTAVAVGDFRPFIDGVAVTLPYGFATRPSQPEGLFAVRVFAPYRVPDRPTWQRDVQPVLQQYANLYPVMRDVLDLGNHQDVLRHRTYMRRTLLAPRESPRHMPATRDLSPGKRDMIVKWLDTAPTPPVLEINDEADLRAVLQQALLIEQATIPPYLAALLSIVPDTNVEIAELIRGIVLEEMQHMTQVANVLNAVGGQPVIGRPGLVPTYPGHLPGPVLPGLRIRLRKLSIEHVRDVFMAIEQPELPRVDGREFRGAVIPRDSVTVTGAGSIIATDAQAMRALEDWFVRAEYTPLTIGWFYNQIAKAIVRLDQAGSLFTGDPGRQVGWPDAPGTLYQVTDKNSALLGIHRIIEQGEGAPHDLNDDDVAEPNELGHYYRFEEIVRGRQLVKDKGTWVFGGAPIRFDPSGVHPMADDPDTYRLEAGSVARRESELCDQYYTNTLSALHDLCNGHPGRMDDVVGLMYQFRVQAAKLYSIPTGDGTVLGPAFQSPGVTL